MFAAIPPPDNVTALRPNRSGCRSSRENGAIAQLGERFNGIEEVVGSIPSGSTNLARNFNVMMSIGNRGGLPSDLSIPNQYDIECCLCARSLLAPVISTSNRTRLKWASFFESNAR
jgi:hypothetical protein